MKTTSLISNNYLLALQWQPSWEDHVRSAVLLPLDGPKTTLSHHACDPVSISFSGEGTGKGKASRERERKYPGHEGGAAPRGRTRARR